MSAALTRGRFLPLMAALSATSWLTLWLWGRSPYSRYLDHGNWTEIGVAGALCRALPGGSEAVTGLLVVAGWLLMLAAMMLPTTLPLLDIFRRLTARRADRRSLMALVITGYLAVWGLFGLAAHLVGWAVLTGMHRSDWLLAHGWVIGAAVLATAGLYQFSALKYRCLDTSAGRRSALSSSTGAARTSVGRHLCSAAGMARFASAAALWLWGRSPYSRYLDHG